MKIKSLLLTLFFACTFTACDTLKNIATAVLPPNEYEMGLGLKQALEQGLFASFDAYGNPAGNPALTFIFPSDAQKIINLANKAGLGSVVNNITGKFNKAVASAFVSAKPIFLNSLRQMTIKDVATILLTNNQQAATDYFKGSTKNELMMAFRPIVDSSIQTQGANRDWKRVADIINNIPFSSFKVESSLTDFVAARAIDGMYMLVADEEKKIRTDINARKTDLIKKVFGYADDQMKKKAGTN